MGVGAIHFIHRDLGDAALRLAERLRVRSGSACWLSWVLDHLDDVTAHRLRQIGVATFFYAGLRVTEGVGLVLEKVWAEYLTVGVTMSFLPWEMYEIMPAAGLAPGGPAGGESAGAGVSDMVAAAQPEGWAGRGVSSCGSRDGYFRFYFAYQNL